MDKKYWSMFIITIIIGFSAIIDFLQKLIVGVTTFLNSIPTVFILVLVFFVFYLILNKKR